MTFHYQIGRIIRATLFLTAISLFACQRQPDTPTPAPTAVAVEVVVTAAPTEVAIETATATAVPPTAVPEPTTTPTATPEPVVKELVVCTAVEPDNLYLYGEGGASKTALLHAIYENLYTSLAYTYQPQGLEKLPDLADDDATINPVSVQAGDLVVDVRGNVTRLQNGVVVHNADGETITYEGERLLMEQMVVRFTLKPMIWSDGTPVTAEDSIYSFTIAAHRSTPGGKTGIERTAAYEAEGDLGLIWTGLPGWRDPHYFTNIWVPLPRHQLQTYSAADLLTQPETTSQPLSNGPFVVSEWAAGEQIQLTRNPHYYRAAEGLPYLDKLTFTFISDPNRLKDELLNGRCHVAAQDSLDVALIPLFSETADTAPITLHAQTGTAFEHIAFGVNPVEEYAAGRRDWFEDARVRQAMVMCTDRQRMIDELFHGRSQMMHAYVPSGHALYPDDLTEWPYDVTAANALLDEAGFLMDDEAGLRLWSGSESPFQVTIGSASGGNLRPQIKAIFQENMADCGIAIEIIELPAGQWFGAGPAGTLFGRRFDLGTFAWLMDPIPPCHLYLTDAIPGPLDSHPAGWSGQNVTGWSDPDFDAACQAARSTFPGTEEYRQNHQEALRIFAQQLPIIPLFPYLKLAATRSEVLNFHLDPTQPSELWNVFEWDVTME